MTQYLSRIARKSINNKIQYNTSFNFRLIDKIQYFYIRKCDLNRGCNFSNLRFTGFVHEEERSNIGR